MCRFNNPPSRRTTRRAVTLVEMLLAMAVLAMMTVALGALTQAVRVSSDLTHGTSTATQHARVTLHRIETATATACANEAFPGSFVVADTIGTYDYPDTLIVWRPGSDPQNPDGLPRFDEIVVFCTNPNAPNELLEITAPGDSRTVPEISNVAAWNSELATLKTGPASQKALLTDLVRTAAPSGNLATSRGAVRFAVSLCPSDQDWADYRAGNIAFADVPWAQTVYGRESGLRQTRVATELQLVARQGNTSLATTIPFFGSAALYWELRP